ncbi:MAG: hypothetical protein A2Z12_05315 [Actinobacteria bacterium RBG_16_68_21]|nr:MAG: hypothetical protein A2Z12_05315 [Actinobacteria bacterium RBG_16_68_21]
MARARRRDTDNPRPIEVRARVGDGVCTNGENSADATGSAIPVPIADAEAGYRPGSGEGYRVRPGTRAVVVRGGNPLRIRRADRPDLVLTADDGDRGAGMINGLLAGLGGTGRARPAT